MRVPSFAQLLSWDLSGFGQIPLTGNIINNGQTPLVPSNIINHDQSPLTPGEDELRTSSLIDGVRTGTTGASIAIHVNSGTRNSTAPFLGGLLFEDIAQSGDGGIYAELIRNRAFQGSGISMGHIPDIPYRSITYAENPVIPFGPVLDGWFGIGNVRLSLDLLHPLSDALQVSLQVDVPLHATGRVGFQNDGWWGIPVLPQTYNASFYAQASGARFNWSITDFDVELRSAVEDRIWCSRTVPIEGRLTPYAHARFKTQLPCDVKAPNVNNTFAITFDAEQARGQTIYFTLMSLFPPTYKDRPNGLRKDLAEMLVDMSPKFLRFPGGNNLEGYSIQRRWKWWKTIGPLEDRPGRPGDWSYYNTDGLGLLEYLIWCEDMNMEPLLAVYAGFSLDIAVYDGPNSTTSNEAAMKQMPAVLQEALEELEYCMGDPHQTYWGKQRAKHGHATPFKISMIEIGNEDFFSHHYPIRAQYLYDELKKVYPDITYIFTTLDDNNEVQMQLPDDGIWDAHVYAPAGWFIRNFDTWDNFQQPSLLSLAPTNSPSPQTEETNTTQAFTRTPTPPTTHVRGSLMEYHASHVGLNGLPNHHPLMGAAVAEAVYAIGGERNPDVYRLSCFAPLLQNVNAWRGTPYDVLFGSDPTAEEDERGEEGEREEGDRGDVESEGRGEGWRGSKSVRSISYWQQWLFNRYPGKETLPITKRGGDGLNPLFWVASVERLPKISEDANGDDTNGQEISENSHKKHEKNKKHKKGHKKHKSRREVVYLKIVNASPDHQQLDVHLDAEFTSVNGTILEPPTRGDMFVYNRSEGEHVRPREVGGVRSYDASGAAMSIENGGESQRISWRVPGMSITVLQFNLVNGNGESLDTDARIDRDDEEDEASGIEEMTQD